MNNQFIKKNENGQALLEYILVFAMMAVISVGVVKGVSSAWNTNMLSLGYVLTDKLSTGVCPKMCFFNNYGNGNP